MFEIKENTNINTGLTSAQVTKNQKKYGTNSLSKKKENSFFKLFIESLSDPIIKILLIALGVKVFFLFKQTDYFETLGIVIAILMASLISSISEYGSEKAFESLQKETSKVKCKIKRNGKLLICYMQDIVVGDIIFLESGDKILADGVLVSGSIKTDESSVTGESKEVKKDTVKNKELYSSTVVTMGEGLMLVTSVGDNTFYGKVAQSLQEKSPISPLKSRLIDLAKVISKIGYIGAFLVVFAYLFKIILINNNFDIVKIKLLLTDYKTLFSYILHALTLAVTIIVVSVPEGLPMMITLVLSSNMKRMLKKNVLVRKLTGIETAGSLNTLYTDKTGTLTKGKLEVVGLLINNKKISKKNELNKDFLEKLTESLIYNNASKFSEGKIIGGNTTDKAILSYFASEYNITLKKVSEEIFDSNKKYSSVTLSNGKKYLKGAHEVLLKNTSFYYDESLKKQKINKEKVLKQIKTYSDEGLRVITVIEEVGLYEKSNILIGFVLLKDEIRKEAKKAVKSVKEAGINLVMITGDTKDTAVSIAKEVGIINSKNDLVLTSEELKTKTDEELKSILSRVKVVSRALPEDKIRLVKLSQELGNVVGMTGDGVNDSPALKIADVGFAMGSGTEVAKEASDIVLIDNNFLSMVYSILFGRTIFKSIRKFIIFQLTVNICAISLSIIGPFIGIETPVTVIQMLWINMVMDTLAALAFSFEPPLSDYMKELPKKKNERIINKYMKDEIIFTGLYSSLLCLAFLKLPILVNVFENEGKLMTAFFGLFIFIAIFNSFNARTHRLNLFANIIKNKVFIFIIMGIVVIQLYMIYYGGELFRTTGLSSKELFFTIILAFTVIPIDFMRKIYLRKKGIIGGV